MTRSNSKLASAVLLAASLLALPLGASATAAQEAMMLETIGAVRMAAPAEVQRMNAAQERSSREQQVMRTTAAEVTPAVH